MSKIYEALRQAELDRSKPGSIPAENGTQPPTTAQALLEMEQDKSFPIRSAAALTTADTSARSETR